MIADMLTLEQYESTCVDAKEENKTGWYNMKLFEFENGTVELREYSEVVGRKPCNMPEQLVIAKALVARIHNQLKKHTVYNPFEDIEMGIYDFDEMELADKRKAHSRYNSRSRTIQQIYNVSRQCRWKWFITLTFSDEKADRYSYSDTMKKARKWFNNQRSRYAPDMQYLIVGEGHKDGAWHVHGLMAQCDGVQFVESNVKHKSGRKSYNIGKWNYGFSYACEVDDISKISSYITKYITKDLAENTGGLRRYYKSNNIPEVKASEFLVDGSQKEAFAQMLADSLGVEQSYEKEVGGYTSVKYKYYTREEKRTWETSQKLEE